MSKLTGRAILSDGRVLEIRPLDGSPESHLDSPLAIWTEIQMQSAAQILIAQQPYTTLEEQKEILALLLVAEDHLCYMATGSDEKFGREDRKRIIQTQDQVNRSHEVVPMIQKEIDVMAFGILFPSHLEEICG